MLALVGAAMLVACRLAGLSALEAYYAGVRVCAQFGRTRAGLARGLGGVTAKITPTRSRRPSGWGESGGRSELPRLTLALPHC